MKRIFWFHYNKPLSKKNGIPQLTLHFKKKCIILDNIHCDVPTYGAIRKQQPYFVMKGKCNDVEIVNNVAFIK